MLNRTNRTLSANLNRLNLGTRSLVLATSLNDGDSTLDVRHAHDSGMRVGTFGMFGPSITESTPTMIPSVPSSSPARPWHGHSRPSPVVGPVRVVVPVVTPAKAEWPVSLQVDQRYQADAAQVQTRARLVSSKREESGRARPERESSSVSRSRSGMARSGRCVAGRTPWLTAVAILATAGG